MSGVHTHIVLVGSGESFVAHPPSEVHRILEEANRVKDEGFVVFDRADGKGKVYIDRAKVAAFAEDV